MIKLPDGTTKLEHRLVWEQHYGPIPPGGVIHHKNGDGRDNRVENLELMQRASHSSLHMEDPTAAQREASRKNLVAHNFQQ